MLRELCEKIEYWLDGDESDPDLYLPLKICLLGFIVISIFVFIGVCTGALSVDVVKSENTPSLGVGTHSEFTGPNPVIDNERRKLMEKEIKTPLTTEVLTIKPGYWNGGVVNQPFVEGYFVTLFIPKGEIEFNNEFHYEELKIPTKELKQLDSQSN